jgi:[ribosomal protein S18]-alanine N-acetyltransferase
MKSSWHLAGEELLLCIKLFRSDAANGYSPDELSPFVIWRPADKGDLAGIMSLEQEVFGPHCFPRDMVERFLSDPDVHTLVIADAAIIAYSMVRLSPEYETAEILSLAVARSHRRQGLGRELIVSMEDLAVKGGFMTLMLCVRLDNAEAVNLYLSQGYRVLARLRDYYEDGSDADMMVKHMEG